VATSQFARRERRVCNTMGVAASLVASWLLDGPARTRLATLCQPACAQNAPRSPLRSNALPRQRLSYLCISHQRDADVRDFADGHSVCDDLSQNAFLVVSISLLGLGFGGTLANLLADRIRVHPIKWMWWTSLAFTGCIPLSMALLGRTHELPLLILCSLPPFTCAGLFLSILFMSWPERASVNYFYDLVGSALGCIGKARNGWMTSIMGSHLLSIRALE
jgi:hypothetical protein